MLTEIKRKLLADGKEAIANRLPDVLPVESSDQELYMTFLREGLEPIELTDFLYQAAEILDTLHKAGFVHGDTGHLNWILGFDGLKLFDFGTARRMDEPIFDETVESLPSGSNANDLQKLRDIYRNTGPLGRGLRLDDPRLHHIKSKAADPKYLMSAWIDLLGFSVMLIQLSRNTRLTSLLKVSESDLHRLTRAADQAVLKLDQFENVKQIADFIVSELNAKRSELRTIPATDVPGIIIQLNLQSLQTQDSRAQAAWSFALELLSNPDFLKKFRTVRNLREAVRAYEKIANLSRSSEFNRSQNELGFNITPKTVLHYPIYMRKWDIILAGKWQKLIKSVFPKKDRQGGVIRKNSVIWDQSNNRNFIQQISNSASAILERVENSRSESRVVENRGEEKLGEPLIIRSELRKISPSVRIPGEAAILETARVADRIGTIGSPLIDLLIAEAIAAEPVTELPSAIHLSPSAGLTGLSIIESVQSITQLDRITPAVTLSGTSLFANLLLGLLRDEAFRSRLADERLEIGISDLDGTFRRNLKLILEGIENPSERAIAGNIFSNYLKVSSDSLEQVAARRINSAVFVESEDQLKAIERMQDLFIAFADWTNVKRRDAIAEMLIPILVSAGHLAKGLKGKTIGEQSALLSRVSEIGFSFDMNRGRNVAVITLAVLEGLLEQVQASQRIAASA